MYIYLYINYYNEINEIIIKYNTLYLGSVNINHYCIIMVLLLLINNNINMYLCFGNKKVNLFKDRFRIAIFSYLEYHLVSRTYNVLLIYIYIYIYIYIFKIKVMCNIYKLYNINEYLPNLSFRYSGLPYILSFPSDIIAILSAKYSASSI